MADQTKSLRAVARGFGSILLTEENKGLCLSLIRQLGIAKLGRAAVKTANTVGVGQNVKDLYHFRMGRLASVYFISMWQALGSREAIVDGERRYTFAQMRDRVLRLCNGLQALGLRPRDRVACLLYNGAEYLECFWAACMLGTPMPAVNWHLSGEEIKDIVNLRGPKVLVFDETLAGTISAYRDRMPGVKHFVMVGAGTPPEGILRYDKLIENAAATIPETSFIFAINPYTGGTTGTPKSANLYDGFSYILSDVTEAPRAVLDEYIEYMVRQLAFLYFCGATEISDPYQKNIRTLIPTPMYHAGTAAGYSPFVMLGGTAVPMRQFDPERFLYLVEKERISWSFVVPTILQRILGLPDEIKRKYDLSTMHTLLCSAAPCPPEVKNDINELFMRQGAAKPVFHEYYGSSEAALVTLLLPADYMERPERIQSVGKARCGDILIYDEEKNRPCAPGETGRVLCRSMATLSLTYPGSAEKLKDSQRIIDGKEWYDDGLIGKTDEDGFLYLTSRVKEMIISGGINIFPAEIERILFMHPDIDDAAVIRAPHPDLGEAAIACIQVQPGRTATEADIQSFCRQKGLKGLKIPQKVDFRDRLPRHIDGKILKRDLEKIYWENHQRLG
ncbi:MAG: AMP-binding protein [Thermodesulfobacteriota bacterium]